MFRKLCGDDKKSLANVKIITTKWDCISPEEGEYSEKQFLEHQFKEMVENGAEMLRHDNTSASAVKILSTILGKSTIDTALQRQLVEEGKGLIDTDAGAEVMDDIEKLRRQHEAELLELQKELKDAADQDKKELQEAIAEMELVRIQDKVKADQAKDALEKDRQKEMKNLQASLDELAKSKEQTPSSVIVDLVSETSANLALGAAALAALAWFNAKR